MLTLGGARVRIATLTLATALAAGLLTERARADDPDASQLTSRHQAARRLYEQSADDQKRGDFAAALEKLKGAAQVMSDHLGVRLNMALCEEQLGQIVPALVHYEDAERFATRDRRQDLLEQAIRPALKRLRERTPRVKINVPPDAPDIEVKIDGLAYNAAMLADEIRVAPGAHAVEATAEGYRTFSGKFSSVERGASTFEIKLERAQPAATANARAQAPSTPPPAEPDSTRSSRRTLAIATTAGAGVLALGGLGAFLRADGLAKSGATACAGRAPGGCEDLRSPVRTWDAIALGAWIGAAGLGAFAVWAWLTPRGQTALQIGPGSVAYGGRF